jgi:hypothetical protein
VNHAVAPREAIVIGIVAPSVPGRVLILWFVLVDRRFSPARDSSWAADLSDREDHGSRLVDDALSGR